MINYSEQLNENRRDIYFSKLSQEILQVFQTNNFKIINFLYNIIFDQAYLQLISKYNNQEEDLNYQIARMILYPIKEQQLNNTFQMISLIPLFLMFVISQKLNFNMCIKQSIENSCDFLLTAVAQKLNHDNTSSKYNLKMFQLKLEMQKKQSQAIDLEKTMNFIENYTKGIILLKELSQMFYYSIFTMNTLNSDDEFINFQNKKKKEIILNTYSFIQNHYQKQIQGTLEDSKMKIAISFLEQKYNYDNITQNFDNLQIGILLFNLIQLDHKQFQNFFKQKQPQIQEELLEKIMLKVENADSFFKLILVGKCLTKLRLWEYALDIFIKLLNKISNNSNKDKDKYRYYILFKIAKIEFLQGQIEDLLKKLFYLSEKISQTKNFEFYQPSNKNLYHQCLVMQLLISTYTNNIDKVKHVTINFNKILEDHLYQQNKKRPLTLLQYEFLTLMKTKVSIFQEREGKKQLEYILQEIKQVCYQRQKIQQKKSNFLKRLKNAIFESPNASTNISIEISSYYKAVEEFLIINVLVRYREINILQYFNPNFYPLLRVFLAQNNFFDLKLKSQIHLFIHDFPQAYDIAVTTQNYKMIALIQESQGQYREAIQNYQKDNSPSSKFNLAILQKICQEKYSIDVSNFQRLSYSQYQEENAIVCFNNLVNQQNQYKQISIIFQQALQSRENSQIITNRITNDESVKSLQKLSQSENSLNYCVKQDLQQQNNIYQFSMHFSYDSGVSGNKNILQTEFDKNNFSEQRNSINFNFPIRKDVQQFYDILKNDLISEKDNNLKKTLDEFVRKTYFLKYESSELFQYNNLGKNIGKGGFSEVYEFQFQDQIYAAKVIQIQYKKCRETINDDEKSTIQKRLLEICIICDLTISKIKYCLQIEHLGFESEIIEGQLQVYKISSLQNFIIIINK